MQHTGLLHNSLRRQHLRPAQPEPGVRAGAFVQIRQGRAGPLLVADIEQIAERLHPVPLPALSQQLAHGEAQVLPHQVQQGALDGPLCLHHEFQLADVQGLNAFSIVPLRPGCRLMDAPENGPVGSDRLPHHQGSAASQRLTGIVSPVDFPNTRVPRAVLQDHQISCKPGRVGSAQGHEHTVIACHGNDLHFRYDRCASVFHVTISSFA
ncbi:hypothetical protein SDC9_147094 [bioreactor metagenome]|uniref:Uncharacterized protein n=1 Tax=bioreactor metagenome TaxID=1076179 RepID=A0A645EEY8_9ZZZZ